MKKILTGVLFLCASLSYSVQVKTVAKGLNKPVHLTVAPGEPGRLYVVEQIGRIRVVEGGQLRPAPFLDISKRVISGGEMGLLSVAFHPDYKNNGRYFVYYTSEEGGIPREVRISELNRDSGGEKKLLQIPHAKNTNHNGGQLAFDSKGLLYIGVGDGGGAGDPEKAGQDTNKLLAKILRIDVNRGNPYDIPSDNPFVKGGGRAEIYAWGLRNPWRFSFAPDGKLWVADVGQYELEEIDLVENGKNYGWNKMEANNCFPRGSSCDKSKYALPIFQYGRDEGQSITGGHVYRGSAIPSLAGKYVYADYVSGNVWALTYENATKKVTNAKIIPESVGGISSFGEDENGELYVTLHFDGAVGKIVPN